MIKKKGSFIVLIVFLVYFLSRSISLDLLPIFNDESTYIRYGLHQVKEADHKPYSLRIGKEPLLPLFYALAGTTSPDLLLGARFVTIIFGVFTLLGLFLFMRELAGPTAALFTGFFYVLSPFNLFFDRLALMDSPVSTIAIWTLYLTYLLFKKPRLPYAIGLGCVMGLGLWIKTSAFFYLFLPVVSYGIYYFIYGEEEQMTKGKMIGCAFVIAIILFLPLFSNPFYAEHLDLLKQYTYPLYSVFLFPFSVWWSNLLSSMTWLFFYLTPPLFVLSFVSAIFFIKQKKLRLVSLWLLAPFLYELLYAKLFTSRHILPLTIPLLIFAGYGFFQLWQKKRGFAYIVGFSIITWCIVYNVSIISAPQNFPSMIAYRAKDDILQYLEGFSSGYGVKEAVNYLKGEAKKKDIVIVIRNDHGNPEDAIVAYFLYKKGIKIIPLNDQHASMTEIFNEIGPSTPIYFVSRGATYAGLEEYLTDEMRFKKPHGEEFVGVYSLKR